MEIISIIKDITLIIMDILVIVLVVKDLRGKKDGE